MTGQQLKFLFCVLPFLLAVNPDLVYAQRTHIQFTHIGSEQGLSHESTTAILQDHLGFLWFGTQNGLNRYDGYTFTTYPHGQAQSPLGKGISTMFEDRQGNLWLGTWATVGVSLFLRATETFIHYQHQPNNPESLTSGEVKAILQDSSGTIWIATTGGLNRFNPQTQTFSHFTHNPSDTTSLSSNSISALQLGPDHTLWIATDNGLNHFDITTGLCRRYQHSPHDTNSILSNNIRTLFVSRSGVLWVGYERGFDAVTSKDGALFASHYNFKCQNVYGFHLPLAVNVIYESHDAAIWLGTESHGLVRFSPQAKTTDFFMPEPDNPHSLSSAAVTSIFQDRSGIMWVGVKSGALNKFNPTVARFTMLELPTRQPQVIESAFMASDGSLWVGTVGGGLYRRPPKSSSWIHYSKAALPHSRAPSSNMILSLYQDHKGKLWIGTWGGGLIEYDTSTQHFTTYRSEVAGKDSLHDNFITSICEDEHHQLWLATWNGLKRFDPHTQRFTSFPHPKALHASSSYKKVRLVKPSADGHLWVGFEEDGLARFNPNTGQFIDVGISESDGFTAKVIRSLYETPSGVLWIGTYDGGLWRFDLHASADAVRLKHFTTAEGLPSNSVFGIVPDPYGNLWLATSNGLCCFNMQTYQARTYNSLDGLSPSTFGLGTYFRDSNGLMYFPTTNGVLCFQPDSLCCTPLSVPIAITSIKVGKKSLPTTVTQIALSPTDIFFSVEFAAMSYRNPSKNRYAYRLEGFDKDWIYSGTRPVAIYTNLDGGTYRLYVKAMSSEGTWGEAQPLLDVTVHPPFWKTWWFFVSVALLSIGILYVSYAQRIRRINERNRDLELEVINRTEALASALNETRHQKRLAEEANEFKTELLGIAAHDLKSPLQSIIGFASVLKEHSDADVVRSATIIERAARNMVQLINELLQSTEVDLGRVHLNKQPCDASLVAKLVVEQNQPLALRKQQSLTLNAEPDCIVYADVARLTELIDNLVSNAIKYSPFGKSITVSCQKSYPHLQGESERSAQSHRPSVLIAVKDEGQGLTEADMSQLFGKFQRLSARPTGGEYSTGLGLSIVKKLVELHGGKVWAESAGRGKGATFFVELPAYVLQQHSFIA
jgi:ligand-binding sensor domain-containing protein/signal transduction histidine kinase